MFYFSTSHQPTITYFVLLYVHRHNNIKIEVRKKEGKKSSYYVGPLVAWRAFKRCAQIGVTWQLHITTPTRLSLLSLSELQILDYMWVYVMWCFVNMGTHTVHWACVVRVHLNSVDNFIPSRHEDDYVNSKHYHYLAINLWQVCK